MKKRILRNVLAFTLIISASMVPEVSIMAENMEDSDSFSQNEIIIEEENEIETTDFTEDNVQIPMQSDDFKDSAVDESAHIDESELDEIVLEIEEVPLSGENEIMISDFTDETVEMLSYSSVTINITDDNGYVWNGYYNSDGTITINGTQELWGNAKTDGSSTNNDALIIPSSIGGKTVTAVGAYNSTGSFDAFDKRLIRKIVLPKTVTSVSAYFMSQGKGLFGGFSNLEELDIGGLYVDSDELFGYAAMGNYSIPLKKLTMEGGYSISWENQEMKARICGNITTIALWGADTVSLEDWDYLQTLEVTGTLKSISLCNCPNLTKIESAADLTQVYFRKLRNCPNLDIFKVRVSGNDLAQSCMFEKSKVQEVTLDFKDTPYVQIYKSVFCKAYDLKAIHVVNAGNTGFYSLDGILFWKAKGSTGITMNDLFFYPPAKNQGGVYQIPSDTTCIYAFAFYGSELSKVVFPEDLTSRYYWDNRDNVGNWYTADEFPELTGKHTPYLGDLSTVKFSMIKGTAANNYSYTVWDGAYGINASRVEFREGSTHQISYNLNGGVNNQANPSSYTVGTAPVKLQNPVKNGYTFVEWRDKNGSKITETEPYSGRGDLTYTAIWKKQEKLIITGSTKKVAAGKRTTLQVKNSSGIISSTNVIWSSSNKKVATVNSKGIVTFKKKTGGKSVVITATLKNDSSVKAIYKLTAAKNPVTKITITGKKTMKINKSQTLKAKVSGKSGAYKSVKWSSSNTKYATVSSKGKVKALKAGKGKTVKITATALDGSGKKATFKIKLY